MSCTKRQRNFSPLAQQALELKLQHRGPHVYFRGLIEISNKCRKNCLYCGIRGGNCNVDRYEMTDEEVMREVEFAYKAGYGSIAIQGGERNDSQFVERITRLLYNISSQYDLGITLSLGEQPIEVYREWMKAGASRYLLRIEASNKELYEKIHPGFAFTGNNARDAHNHSYERRVQALHDLKSAGYLLGSGIMIGLPFQTRQHLDEDLKFLKDLQVDMVGMGPYIPHKDTPLGQLVAHWKEGTPLPDSASPVPLCQEGESQMGVDGAKSHAFEDALVADSSVGSIENPGRFGKLSGGYNLHALAGLPRGEFWNLSGRELLELCLEMVARLRIMMPHINIAATTALQVLDPMGREMALMHGANVIMPNMTETSLRGNYSLYEGKHGVEDDAVSTRDKLLENLSALDIPVGWNLRGDWR